MNPIDAVLDRYPVMILDGALATELERRGCDLRDRLWSATVLVEAPENIKRVHAEYLTAGADCITTATYQATLEGFQRRGFSPAEGEAYLRLAVQLAIEARDEFWADPANRARRPKPLVAASIGPYGAFLADGSEYSGNYALSEKELADFHRARLDILASTEADLLAFETIPSLREALVLARLLGEHPGRYAWVSFSARDREYTSHRERIIECAAQLDAFEQIAAIGVNCTDPQYIPDLVRAMRSATAKPLIVYPNSGEVWDAQARSWQGARDSWSFVMAAAEWYAAGARILGGCCRTTPAEIEAITSWARAGERQPLLPQ